MFCLRWHDSRIRTLSPLLVPEEIRDGPILNNITTISPSTIRPTNQPHMHYRYYYYHRVSLTGSNVIDRIWIPPVEFRNANNVTIVHTLRPVRYMNVWPGEKRLELCTHIRASHKCSMALSSLPFDQQYCYFELETVLEGSVQQGHVSETRNNPRIRLKMESMTATYGGSNMFRLRATLTGECDPDSPPGTGSNDHERNDFDRRNNDNNNNTRSCVYGGVHLVRHLSYYVIRYYAPTFLTVCMPMCEFWIPVNAWPARIILAATVLLGNIRVAFGAYQSTPVRDVCSLFWWIWGIQTIIYLCLCGQAFSLSWHHFVVDRKRVALAGLVCSLYVMVIYL